MANYNILGLIPARGGSKGIKNKNIKDFCGIPLVAWTIDAALNSSLISDVVVSTDDPEIAKISKSYGARVPYLRPPELSGDHSLRNEVIRHALEMLDNFDYVVLLQPTSPLRNAEHIDQAIRQTLQKKALSCVSVVEQHPSPYWMFSLCERGPLKPILSNSNYKNRQSLPKHYSLNGALFIGEVKHFLTSQHDDPLVNEETIPYIMNPENSVDIDTDIDWLLAELIMKSNKHQK